MKSNLKLKNKQKGKTKTLRVQTDVRAGGFYDWWQGVAEGWNMRDRSSTGTV